MEQLRRLLSRPRRQQVHRQENRTNRSSSITYQRQVGRRSARWGPDDELSALATRHEAAHRRQQARRVQKQPKQPPMQRNQHDHNNRTAVQGQNARRSGISQGAFDSLLLTNIASPVPPSDDHFPPLSDSVKIPASSVWCKNDTAKVLSEGSGVVDAAEGHPPSLWKEPEAWPRDSHRVHHADFKKDKELTRLQRIMDSTEFPPLALQTREQPSDVHGTPVPGMQKGILGRQEYVFSGESNSALVEDAPLGQTKRKLHGYKHHTEHDDQPLQHPEATTPPGPEPPAVPRAQQAAVDPTPFHRFHQTEGAAPSSIAASSSSCNPCQMLLPLAPTRPIRIGRLRDHPPVGKLGHHYAQDASGSRNSSLAGGAPAAASAVVSGNVNQLPQPKVSQVAAAAADGRSANDAPAEAPTAQDTTPSTCAATTAPGSPLASTGALETRSSFTCSSSNNNKAVPLPQKQQLHLFKDQKHSGHQHLLLSVRKKAESSGSRLSLRFRPVLVASGTAVENKAPGAGGVDATKGLAGSRRARGAVVLLRQRSSLRMVETAHHVVRQRSRPQWIAKQQQHQQHQQQPHAPQQQGGDSIRDRLTCSNRQDNEFWKRRNCDIPTYVHKINDLMAQENSYQLPLESQRQPASSKVTMQHRTSMKRIPKQLQHLRNVELHLRQPQKVAHTHQKNLQSTQPLQPRPHQQPLQRMPMQRSNPSVAFGELKEADERVFGHSSQPPDDMRQPPPQHAQQPQALAVPLPASGSTEWVRVVLQQYAAGERQQVDERSWHPLFAPPQQQLQYYDGPWPSSELQHQQRHLSLDSAAVPASPRTAEAPQVQPPESSLFTDAGSNWCISCSIAAEGGFPCMQQLCPLPQSAATMAQAPPFLSSPPLDGDRRWSLRLPCGCACSSGCCCAGSSCLDAPYTAAATAVGGDCAPVQASPRPFAPCCDGLRFPDSSAPCALLSQHIAHPTALLQQGTQQTQNRQTATESLLCEWKRPDELSLEHSMPLRTKGGFPLLQYQLPVKENTQQQKQQRILKPIINWKFPTTPEQQFLPQPKQNEKSLQHLQPTGADTSSHHFSSVVSDESGKSHKEVEIVQSERPSQQQNVLQLDEEFQAPHQGQRRHLHVSSESLSQTGELGENKTQEQEAEGHDPMPQKEPGYVAATSELSSNRDFYRSGSKVRSSSKIFATEKKACTNAQCHLSSPFCHSVRPSASFATCIKKGDIASNLIRQPTLMPKHQRPQLEDMQCQRSNSRARSASSSCLKISASVETAC